MTSAKHKMNDKLHIDELSEEDDDQSYITISDKRRKSKARASLPRMLAIIKLTENESCVTSKSSIRVRTRFGPLDAPVVPHTPEATCKFPMKCKSAPTDSGFLSADADSLYFDTTEEESCNWMCFVRPASSSSEQNLDARIIKGKVFFTTIRDIKPSEELKVWYSPQYAQMMKKTLLASVPVESSKSNSRSKRTRRNKASRFTQDVDEDDGNDTSVRSVPPKKRGWKCAAETKSDKEAPRTDSTPLVTAAIVSLPPSTQDFSGKEIANEYFASVAAEGKNNKLPEVKPPPVVHKCDTCGKKFSRKSVLRVHLTVHSESFNFLCDDCGRAFKRRDKLADHIKRFHSGNGKIRDRSTNRSTFVPQVPPTDIDRFFFKCRLCAVGFQRRGMLVNHLSKRHPEVNMSDVPELTIPLVRKTNSFVCPYCNKSYRSFTKRTDHIKKHHPGHSVPPTLRESKKRTTTCIKDPLVETRGTVQVDVVPCEHCLCQYTSKSKMIKHLSVKHPEEYALYKQQLRMQTKSSHKKRYTPGNCAYPPPTQTAPTAPSMPDLTAADVSSALVVVESGVMDDEEGTVPANGQATYFEQQVHESGQSLAQVVGTPDMSDFPPAASFMTVPDESQQPHHGLHFMNGVANDNQVNDFLDNLTAGDVTHTINHERQIQHIPVMQDQSSSRPVHKYMLRGRKYHLPLATNHHQEALATNHNQEAKHFEPYRATHEMHPPVIYARTMSEVAINNCQQYAHADVGSVQRLPNCDEGWMLDASGNFQST